MTATLTAPPSRWVTPPTAEAVTARHGAAGYAWLTTIDSTIETLCERWSLTPTVALGGGKCSAVVAAHTADGNDVVVKVAPEPNATSSERHTYQAWRRGGGNGKCPQVLHHDPDTGALCVTRVRPGHPLEALADHDDTELELLGSVIALTTGALHYALSHRSVTDHIAARHDIIRRRITELSPAGAGTILAAADAARNTLDGLEHTEALCHGDLHGGNLLSGEHGYTLIDPIGLLGPAEFDAAFFAVTRGGGHGIDARADAYTTHLGLDPTLLEAYITFLAADRLIVEHWYRLDPTVIAPLTELLEARTRR